MLRFIFCIYFCWVGFAANAGFSGKVHVIDGDTIDVGDVRVRLHGVDAPEKDQNCNTLGGQEWSCGSWVSEQLKIAFEGHRARCKSIEVDRYGRKVAQCKSRGNDIGGWLVDNGLAFAYRKYSKRYIRSEDKAKSEKRGLHSMQMQTPAAHRKSRIAGRIPPDPNCAIKGNISADGRHIYHTKGQQFYDRTGIDPKKGERWFCNEQAAKHAGWMAAKR